MPFPQNTKLIFIHNKKVIHSLSASFETQGWSFKAVTTYLETMKNIFEAEPKEGDTTMKIDPS